MNYTFKKISSFVAENKISLFGLYLFFLVVLNVLNIHGNDFWCDEAFSIHGIKMESTIGLLSYLARGEIDLFPPFYYLTARTLCKIFGYNGFVYQFISLIPLVVIAFFSMIVLRKEFGLDTAVLFVTFCALLRNALCFNIEVRAYSFALLFVLLSYYMLYKVIQEGSWKDYTLLMVFSLLAAYSHYFALVSVAFFYVGLLFLLPQKKSGNLLKICILYFTTFILYLPWLIAFWDGYISKLDGTKNRLSYEVSFFDCMNYLFSGRWYSAIFFGVLIIEIIYVLLYSIEFFNREEYVQRKLIRIPEKTNRLKLYNLIKDGFSLWTIIGVLSIVGTSLVGVGTSYITGSHFFLTRYLYPVSVVAWLLISTMMTRCINRKQLFAILMGVMLTVGSAYYVKFAITFWRGSELIKKTYNSMWDLRDSDKIIIINDAITECGAEYYFPGNEVFFYATEDLSDNKLNAQWIIVRDMDSKELINSVDLEKYLLISRITGGSLGDTGISVIKLERI